MASDIFTVTLMGRVASDPADDFAKTAAGNSVVTILVKCYRPGKDKETGEHRKPILVHATAYDNQAEQIRDYVRRRDRIVIIGRIIADEEGQPRAWLRGADGACVAKFEVVIENFRSMTQENIPDIPTQEEPA